jgi:uncharacterized protein YecT (DUF1311 family)
MVGSIWLNHAVRVGHGCRRRASRGDPGADLATKHVPTKLRPAPREVEREHTCACQRLRRGTLATVCARAGLFVCVLAAAASFSATAHGALRRPTLPVRASPNSVAGFPCPRSPIATLDIEACEGHKQLALGRHFNRLTAVLWPILDATGRGEFVSAHRAWLAYRDAECSAQARAVLAGTAAGVIFAVCETAITRTRVKELAGTVAEYCGGRVKTGPYRHCPRR